MAGADRFTARVAFITGAASGIGRAAAIAFATEGARVAILDLTANCPLVGWRFTAKWSRCDPHLLSGE